MQELISGIAGNYEDETDYNVSIRLDVVNLDVNFDQLIPVGLIVNEVVTNSYKYAFPEKSGEIFLKVLHDEDRLKVQIGDNGIGSSSPEEFKRDKSLGMNLINILSKQIRADLKIQTAPGQGVQYDLEFVLK